MKKKITVLSLILTVLLSCNSLRHYKKVATDTDVTQKELQIITPWVHVHFAPQVEYVPGKEIVVTDTVVDTKAVDSLIRYIKNTPQVNIDSIEAAILATCVTKTIKEAKKTVDTIKVPDVALIKAKDNQYNTLHGEYIVAIEQRDKIEREKNEVVAKETKYKTRIAFLTVGIVVILLAIVAYIVLKLKRVISF